MPSIVYPLNAAQLRPYLSQNKLGVAFGALSSAILLFCLWNFAGVGWATPQQRVLPFALVGSILYCTEGLSALLFLVAPSRASVSWSVARVAAKVRTVRAAGSRRIRISTQ